MGQANEASFPGPADLRSAARFPDGPGVSRPGGAAGLSGAEPPDCHDVAGRGGVHQGRSRDALSRSLASGVGSAVTQGNHANARAALQDTGTGAERTLDAYSGLQPDPYDHRTSRQQARPRTPIDQFQG